MKKLNAILEPTDMKGQWEVTVTDMDTGKEVVVVVTAASEGGAAFKAMEQVNGSE